MMAYRKLLSTAILAIFAGLSIHYFFASSAAHNLTEPLQDHLIVDVAPRLSKIASSTNHVANVAKTVYTQYFADDMFITASLASHPDMKAAVDLLRHPLRAMASLDSDIDLSDCKAILNSLEKCASWSKSTFSRPLDARLFVSQANARVHNCIKAVDKVTQQHVLLSTLATTLAHNGTELLTRETLPCMGMLFGFQLHGQDVCLCQWKMRSVSAQVELWHANHLSFPEFLASTRKFLSKVSGKLMDMARVGIECDTCLSDGLSGLSGYCYESRMYLDTLRIDL
jgi:hypothetical protein